MKEKALHRTGWKTRFGRGCGPFVRQEYVVMNDDQIGDNY